MSINIAVWLVRMQRIARAFRVRVSGPLTLFRPAFLCLQHALAHMLSGSSSLDRNLLILV